MNSQKTKNESDLTVNHSTSLSIILHLLPGAIASILYFILAPLLNPFGYPSILTFLLIAILVIIPLELGIVMISGHGIRKKASFVNSILYRETVPLTQYFIFVPSLLIWAILGYTVIAAPIDTFLFTNLFHWIPEHLLLNEIIKNLPEYSKNILIITFVIGFLVNGIIGPIVEEIYFRGFLLPRISRFGRKAPLINTVLFSLYHFFTPWQILSRIIGLFPLVYVVWWKKNIYIGIWVHCLMNSIATLTMAVAVLKALS